MIRWAIAIFAFIVAAVAASWVLRLSVEAPELRVLEVTTPHTSDPWSFSMSPDGRYIAFVSDRDGRAMLWVRALNSANAQALAGTEGARRPFWSPDSRSIGLFMNNQVRKIEVQGGSIQT